MNHTTVTFKIFNEDKTWVESISRADGLDASFVETDGLLGGAEWLDVVIPLTILSIPYIAKIIITVIEKYGPTRITCGDIVVDKVPQKDVTEVLSKMAELNNKIKEK